MTVAQLIQKNQQQFNLAFNAWLDNGCIEGDDNWNTMFLILYEVCQNQAKAMLKGKFFIEDVSEKALDAAAHIMKYQIKIKKLPIQALGAFVKGPLMNELWGVKTRKHEHIDSLDELEEQEKTVCYHYDKHCDDEQIFYVDNIGIISEEQIQDSTFMFELEWYAELNAAEQKVKKLIKSQK